MQIQFITMSHFQKPVVYENALSAYWYQQQKRLSSQMAMFSLCALVYSFIFDILTCVGLAMNNKIIVIDMHRDTIP